MKGVKGIYLFTKCPIEGCAFIITKRLSSVISPDDAASKLFCECRDHMTTKHSSCCPMESDLNVELELSCKKCGKKHRHPYCFGSEDGLRKRIFFLQGSVHNCSGLEKEELV
jgi:hypothetical protein